MSKEKKELVKKFKVVIEDLLDHYEIYTDEENAQIKEVFEKVAQLNKVLDKYDIDKYDVEKKTYWKEYVEAYSQYFDLFHS